MRQLLNDWRRWIPRLWLGALYIAFAGYSLQSLIEGFTLLGFVAAFCLIEAKTKRPRRSFYRVALASTWLLLVLVRASWQGEWVLAGVTWAGVTVLALIVAFHYQRTEPPF